MMEKLKDLGEAFCIPISAKKAMFFHAIGSSLSTAMSALMPFAAERLIYSGSAKHIVHLVQILSGTWMAT
jgi:hypothetical protein